MFHEEYVNFLCYSMYYHYLKRFIDIFFYEFILPNMRFGILGWSHNTVTVGQDFAKAGTSLSVLSTIFLVTIG